MAKRVKKQKVTMTSRKRLILARVEDLAQRLAYLDRKNDEEVKVADFEQALESGEITLSEINAEFLKALKIQVAHLNIPQPSHAPQHRFINGIYHPKDHEEDEDGLQQLDLNDLQPGELQHDRGTI